MEEAEGNKERKVNGMDSKEKAITWMVSKRMRKIGWSDGRRRR